MKLASSFGGNTTALRSNLPLTDLQIREAAPSIFAEGKHGSRSERYTYIPTINILQGLRKEGFSPFMVVQSRCRDEAKREFTKHMVRLRHAGQINGEEANEVILLNSHDGTSAYQMLAGVLRFVCLNGLVCGDCVGDLRVRHSGNVVDNVIEGACRIVDDFVQVDAHKEAMKALSLDAGEQAAFARAALALRYDPDAGAPPVCAEQVLRPKRVEDRGADLWRTLNRVQENMLRGGLRGRTSTGQVRTTRQITSIDQGVKLNRGLWVLAEEMGKLKE